MVEYLRFSKDDLYQFCIEAFTKAGVPKSDAELLADHLVTASLRGVDSHGVIRVPYYVDGIKKGLVSPVTKITIIKETPISALIDGGKGLGIVVANEAMKMAIKKAKNSGVGLIGAKNLGHVGMLAYYTKKIAKEKLIGFAFANGPALVAPWGGAEKVFGTNPLSYAFPVDDKEPIVLDIATSAMASFKIKVAALRGEKIPEGVGLDPDGNPTTDPTKVFRVGTILPFGKHKGYGLSLLVELMSYVLTGALPSTKVPIHASVQGGFFIMAVDPTLFRSYEEYSKDVKELMEKIKSCKPAKGFDEVFLPGEIEDRTTKERLEKGIPIDKGTLKELEQVAKELNIRLPKPLDT